MLSQQLHVASGSCNERSLSAVTVSIYSHRCSSIQIDRLPVFYKQRDALFFPTWAYVVPTNLGRIPVSFLETTIWVGECMLQAFCAFLQWQGWY